MWHRLCRTKSHRPRLWALLFPGYFCTHDTINDFFNLGKIVETPEELHVLSAYKLIQIVLLSIFVILTVFLIPFFEKIRSRNRNCKVENIEPENFFVQYKIKTVFDRKVMESLNLRMYFQRGWLLHLGVYSVITTFPESIT